MLESLVASILNRVLGSYVENFDPNQLQIGLLSGDVKLHGLKLKKGALDQLKLPVNVINGHIGSLVLQIPYSNLKSKPVKVFIEDVFLIAKPDMEYEEEGQKRREQVAKMEKLQLWELTSERAMNRTLPGSGADDSADQSKQQNFTSSLVTKIIENLQVTIRNIHVRFEDLDVGVAMGATLGELSALSTNKSWEPAFIANVDSVTHKLVTLDSLAFYIDPEVSTEFCSPKLHEGDKAKILEEFKAMIFDSVGSTDILRPINGQGFVTMNKKPTSENVPRIKADLKFEELSMNLDREQYVDILRLTERFQKYFNSLKFRKNRPRVSAKEDPLAWFRYAAQTVLDGVREKNRVWTWEAMKRRLDDQKQYVALYKKWYQAGGSPQGLSAQEKQTFEDLQQHYQYNDLVFFRSLAKQELLRENGSLKDSRRPQQQQQSWSEWLWGSKNTGSGTQSQNANAGDSSAAAPIEITDEQRLELLDVLDEPSLGQDAATQTLLAIDFSLRSAGIRLKAGDMSLASAGFEGVRATFINKPDSFSYEMGLAKFAVSDLTHSNKFSELIRIQQQENADADATDSEDEDFFWLFFEHHPTNRIADSNLFVKSKSIVIVHNARLMESVMKFFSVPPDQGDTVEAILSAANRTVEELREQTRIGLEYALENHKTLNLQLDIKAPTIIVPLDANNNDSAALIMDIGSLEMASDLVPQNVLQEVKSKQALKYTQTDWKRLESLMYDRFTIKLCDTQILLGETISEMDNMRGKDSSKFHFLDKTTLQFLLEISIVPRNSSLTRSRVSIRLPSLRATLSDVQYMLFMKIVTAATLKSEDTVNHLTNVTVDADDASREPSPEAEKRDLSASPSESNKEKDATLSPQRMFELVFIVNEVHFFVVKGWSGKPLVDMCLHDFNVKFWTATNTPDEELAVDVTIRDLLISDHVDTDGPAELRKIAESVGHGDKAKSDYNLFSVEYRKNQSGDMSVNMNLDAIRFTVNPNSVLEVYDYVMSTFTAPQPNTGNNNIAPIANESRRKDNLLSTSMLPVNTLKDRTTAQAIPEKTSQIFVTLNMHGVSAVLVENSQSIALLSMERTTIKVALQGSMKLQVILGSVSVRDSLNNDVLSIERGADLADFRYETEPFGEDGVTPTGPSLVYLRMGKVKLSVLEAPLTQITCFLSKLTAMKSAYDQARMMAFNQAIQVEPGMFLFDVVISSPIIYWPCEDDWLRLNLGEVFFRNKFDGTINYLTAGIHHAQMISLIHEVQREIVAETGLSINMIHTPDKGTHHSPDFSVKSELSPIHVHTTEHQYKLLMMFLASLSTISQGAASAGLGEEEVGNLRRQLAKEKHITEKQTSYWWGENFSGILGGGGSSDDSNLSNASERNIFGFTFEAPLFDITLEMNEKPLSQFSIRDVAVQVNVNDRTGTAVDFHIKSFSADDLGSREENQFTQIIPPVKHNGYQVMGRVVQEVGKPLNVDCSIDSPQVIIALEYMLRLKAFIEYGAIQQGLSDSTDDESEMNVDDDYDYDLENDASSSSTTNGDYSRRPSSGLVSGVNSSHESLSSPTKKIAQHLEEPSKCPVISIDIVDMYLTVLADEKDKNSEAIVFKIEQFKFNTNAAPTVEISKIGMYLMRMQFFESYQLRILDDFNITCWFDNSESTEDLRLANAKVRIDPLVLRISLREICLILSIVSKASEIWSYNNGENTSTKFAGKKATNFFADDHRVARPSKRSVSDDDSSRDNPNVLEYYNQSEETAEVTRILSEHLNIECKGLRVVLIDPIHQLPVTDFCVKPFTLEAKNWSDSLVADVKVELFANVHSFTKSAWEPLIDTMELGLSVTKDSVTVYSDSVANFEVTTETLELVRDFREYFNNASSETIMLIERDEGAPYRIRNETGIPITIWADSNDSCNHKRNVIRDGEEIKWAFHDWRILRENLNVIDQGSCIGIEFEDNYFEPLQNVAVNRIGEHVCVIRRNGRKERLIVDIWVDNHLKYITIRSTYLVNNRTATPLELLLTGSNESNGNSQEILEMPPHSSKSLPLAKVDSHIFIRKVGDAEWSKRSIYWKDFARQEDNKSHKVTVDCGNDFLLTAIPEIPDVPVSNVYPYMSLNLTAPFQIVNNLPRDVTLRLYCRSTRMDSQLDLEKAGRALIHNYSDDSLLLLRVDLEGYKCSKFSVINTGKANHEFHVEDYLEVTQGTQALNLRIEYMDLPHGHGRTIVVYSPYIIVNNTDREFAVASYSNRLICPVNSASLWSFNNAKSHGSQRVTLSCQDTHTSPPVCLDTSGTAAEVRITSRDKQRELHFGVAITPGSGRYTNTKIVTVTPRFVICNNLDRALMLRELGGSEPMLVDAGGQSSVGFIRAKANKEMCVKFGDSDDAQWSSGFIMANVGSITIRLTEAGKPTVLVKAEVILEGATLFVNFSLAKGWPFSIRNFTDSEFIFYQSDPLVDDDGADMKNGYHEEFRPITYRLPPRSAMPYSWDYPAALVKQVVLETAPHTEVVSPPMPPRPPQTPPRPSAASSSAVSILSRSSMRDEYSSSTNLNTSGTSMISSAPTRRRAHRTIKRRKVQLAEIGELPPANFGNGSVVDLSVIADGPQLALVISPYNPELSHYDARTNKVKSEAIEELETIESTTSRTFNLNLKTIGISCITPDSQELFYATLHNLKVGYNVSEAMETVSLQVQWIQIDNSLPGASDFPVVFYPTVLPKAAEELAAHPCFSVSLTRMRDESFGVTYIKHATLLLQEMSIEVDEDFLLGLLNLALSINTKTKAVVGSKNRAYIPILEDETILCESDLHVPRPSGDATPDIYFEQLHLQPIQLNLSFVRTGSLTTVDVFKDAGNLALIIDALTLTIGNINVAPLRFNALLVDNVRTHAANLMSMIQVHYQQEFIYQLHKVLGSADIIGNPVGLFNNISSGVVDLFYEPYLGYTLHDRPAEFGVGLAKGGLSFMKKSVFGISDSISKVTGSLSKGLTAMTLDNRYQTQQRARRSRNRPKHAVYGLRYGLESFYESFSSGVMGLAEQPMQGALTEGSSGFFRGLGVGLLGLPTKTTIGLLDFASNITEGIRNTTTVFDAHSVSRVRLPRVISMDGVIRPYNARESVGQMLLHSVREGRYSKDHYLAHSNITKNKVVIVSLQRVMVVSLNESSLEWSLSYSQVDTVAVEQSGIAITLRGGAHGPFIPLSDPNARQYIYKNIAKGASEFNRKRISLS